MRLTKFYILQEHLQNIVLIPKYDRQSLTFYMNIKNDSIKT